MRAEDAFGQIVSRLDEAQLFILSEMLVDYIRMRQELNVQETPENEEELLMTFLKSRHAGETLN